MILAVFTAPFMDENKTFIIKENHYGKPKESCKL